MIGDERGTVAVEFTVLGPLVLLVAVIVWQFLLVAASVTGVEHAARNASRALGRGADMPAVQQAATAALPGWVRSDAQVRRFGSTRVEVTAHVPLVFPGVTVDALTVTRTAELPTTD